MGRQHRGRELPEQPGCPLGAPGGVLAWQWELVVLEEEGGGRWEEEAGLTV